MIQRYFRVEEKIVKWFKEFGYLIVFGMVCGVAVYFTMLSCNLVNDVDGIWHTSNFIAGDWEISLGRGLQRYFDKMRFGVVSVPLNSLITLCLISFSCAFIVDIFKIQNKLVAFLLCAVIIINPVICCSLSYSYMSVNFGLAFLFSVLAVKILVNEKEKKMMHVLGGEVWQYPWHVIRHILA